MLQDSIIIYAGIALAFFLFSSVIYQFSMRLVFKIMLCLAFILLSIFVAYHAIRQSELHAHISEYENAFKNKEILICVLNNKEYHVNKANFIYFPDILLFMGKNDNKGINISIQNCVNHVVLDEMDIVD